MSREAVVLGAGVTGLSVSLRLQEAGYRVTIVARDFPRPSETLDPLAQVDYTTPWGGAHNRWALPPNLAEERREHAMTVATFRRLRELAAEHPEAGVTFLRAIDHVEAPGPEHLGLTPERADELGIEGFSLLEKSALPAGVNWGCEYPTWCVNPMVYCAFLLRRLVFRGARLVQREVHDLLEVFDSWDPKDAGAGRFPILVNASGYGVVEDKNMFIVRGQICLVANHSDISLTRQNKDGSWNYSIPRNFEGGTIIGGTKEPDNWDPKPSAAIREKLLTGFAAAYPPILGATGKFEVICDIVGRRPTRRGGFRLESETLLPGKNVVHAYGVGGRGYELSWGLADAVLDQVNKMATP